MRNRVVINSWPQAFRVIKEMDLGTEQWDADYRVAGRGALARIVEQQMMECVSRHLEQMGRVAEADRRNGSFSPHLLTELGDIELHVPRTRRFSPISVLRAYARRAAQIDQLILACFVLGISTRKVAHALLPILGEPVSATTVSRVARTLDTAVEAISHVRSLSEAQKALGRFRQRWLSQYPKAVNCLLKDEETLLTFFSIKEPSLWTQLRTTNAIERRFREVRRRTRPMGVFSDRTSMERILYAVFSYENLQQGTGTPFLMLTQNS